MTVPAPEDTGDAGLQHVQSDDRVLEFTGSVIARSSTFEDGKPRWTELVLWRVRDASGRYVLQRAGQSLVYHRPGGSCNLGTATSARNLTPQALPCPRCHPLPRDVIIMQPGAIACPESPRYTAVVCESPRDVLGHLRLSATTPAQAEGLVASSYSAPAQRLLDEARQTDEGIRQALAFVERL